MLLDRYCQWYYIYIVLHNIAHCITQVAGSSHGQVPLRSNLRQATYTCVSLSPSSITWYLRKDSYALGIER